MSRLARRYLVHGRVQGVGFRAFVVRNLEGSGTTGWIRNVGRTTVEAVGCGTSEQLAALEGFMRTGPINARVDRLETFDISATDSGTDFSIGRSVKE